MYEKPRIRLVDWLRKQLIGPAGRGYLQMSPLERYPTGVLHPIEPGISGLDPAPTDGKEIPEAGVGEEGNLLDDADEEDSPATSGKEDEDGRELVRPLRRRRYVPPSSVGFSFCVRGHARLLITASASRYIGVPPRDSRGRFRPRQYERANLEEWSVTWKNGQLLTDVDDLWEGRAGIHVRTRPHPAGTIFTVSLYNKRSLNSHRSGSGRTQDRIEKALFETSIGCAIEAGRLVDYPRVDPSLLTGEEQELELQYRDRRIYAVGHGAAVNWEVDGNYPRIWSEFMPATEVPLVAAAGHGEHAEALLFGRLAKSVPHRALVRFVEDYGGWVSEQHRMASGFGNDLERATAERMCGRMDAALERMRRGVELLRTDKQAARSFRMANRAMHDQMRRAADGEVNADALAWRPFQLAFLLAVMESVIREDDPSRDVLDLIWFPTGGGKTEAYLGLVAFLIVWRRLQYGSEGAGTVALMRYTLRLLTRQQFERAAGIICALELIRRHRPALLGEAPITAGIWVGGAITPNRFDQALEVVNEIGSGQPEARLKLLMDRCPWCRAELDPGSGCYGATHDDFRFHCFNTACEFGRDSRPLPCNVVDEALYKEPPSLLVGTIDKFARLAWEPRGGAFLGAGVPARPPELIIQDELHLITGPLGSVAGLYEAGIDTALKCAGVRPKYIASTATIRMAREQVRSLYARDLAVFPPPGLSCDDSWFAITDRKKAGRSYIGYLAPALDRQHCMAPLAAALLMAPHANFNSEPDREALLDAWWTQVVYHGSLKGVGNSHNAFVIDVRGFGRRLLGEMTEAARSNAAVDGGKGLREAVDGRTDVGEAAESADEFARIQAAKGIRKRFEETRIAQLTSLSTAQENAETFRRLASDRSDGNCLDAVLATNMVSVGLDVSRLALMVVNGQPLTTAEYIQATSRVGRADVPGLILANYYRNQARSLSHYETFRPYHESFYRFVEPSSVTPYTFQVRTRALHAALVIALRCACPHLRGNTSAALFDPEHVPVQAVITALKQRCAAAAGDSAGIETRKHVDRLVTMWREVATRCEDERRQLQYQAGDKTRNAERLLRGHGERRPALWRTLHSMRNVESTAMFRLHG